MTSKLTNAGFLTTPDIQLHSRVTRRNMLDIAIIGSIILAIGAVLFVLSRALDRSAADNTDVSFAAGKSQVDQQPFRQLPAPRQVSTPRLPDDLATFYAQHEGVGLESTPFRLVRLCELAEVQPMTWSDLHIFGAEPFPGWGTFTGYRLGVSSFFDDIVYVTACPRCPPGAIVTFGVTIMGPGGSGPFPFECALVLASSFGEWLQRLEQMQWVEYALLPGEVTQLPQPRQAEVYAHYKNLNPEIDWYRGEPTSS